METNARYLTVGAFTLAVLAAISGFVFWLNRAGGLTQRDSYVVRFEESVSGLQPGAAVLFDGVRVGEVAALNLDGSDPKHVLVTIAVVTGTPVRSDTLVGIEAQGLTGSAAVSLEGGSPVAPPVSRQNGQLPVLQADRAAAKSLTRTTREALRRVDGILADNADSFKVTVDNLKTFSGALARNSGRVDAILLGLEKMTAVVTPPAPPIFDLAIPTIARAPGASSPGQIVILDPTTVLALQTQRLLTRSPDGQLQPAGTAQWSDTLPKLVQEKILQGFEDAGLAAILGPVAERDPKDRELRIDLRRFDVATGVKATADVSLSATITGRDGHASRTRVFQTSAPTSNTDEKEMVKALGEAFRTVASDLAAWIATES